MKPIYFKQANHLDKGNDNSLPMHYWANQSQCVSCWKPSTKERLKILFGGKIWLGVYGKRQPSVYVSGEQVFSKKPKYQMLRHWLINLRSKLNTCKYELE